MKQIYTKLRYVVWPWMRAAWLDLTSAPPPPLVPNRRDIFIGLGDFVAGGNQIQRELEKNGLTPDMAVLDIGSGQGRAARPMTEFLSEKGSYTGLEIVKRGVDWCKKNYTAYPNFDFVLADIYNKVYNRKGTNKGSEYRFPFEDNSFDFIFLTSVFTHMLKADVENYLSEMRRVLKPGGRTFISWFILNDETHETSLSGRAAFVFQHAFDPVSYVVSQKNPEGTIGFKEDYVRVQLAKHDLQLQGDIYRGNWALSGGHFFQDYTVADKII